MNLEEFGREASAYRIALSEMSRLVELANDKTLNLSSDIEEQKRIARRALKNMDPVLDRLAYRHIDLGDGDSVDMLLYATAVSSSRGSGALRVATVYLDAFEAYLEKLARIQDSQDLLQLTGEQFSFSHVRWGDRSASPQQMVAPKGSVFLVHGHNERAVHETARFLERLGLVVVVLRELPNSGRSIIEKFIEHSNVEFAVVLLTGDDLGRAAKDESEILTRRARQNVIFELGFFIGKLGRDKVCTLYEPGVDIPSDYSGVLFTRLDPEGLWKLELARELKAAGLPIDLNMM